MGDWFGLGLTRGKNYQSQNCFVEIQQTTSEFQKQSRKVILITEKIPP
jgi:hypothetical protein